MDGKLKWSASELGETLGTSWCNIGILYRGVYVLYSPKTWDGAYIPIRIGGGTDHQFSIQGRR